MKKLFILGCWLLAALFASAQVRIHSLRCEQLSNPAGIDETQPRFSWNLESGVNGVVQQSYQLLVASSRVLLDKNQGDIWNSGKVQSPHSVLVPFAGKPLQSRHEYFWKVKAFTNKGETSWSEPAKWSMGLLQKTDWKARWIGYEKPSRWDSISQWSRLSARYFRKTFNSPRVVKRATAYISGLGLYELYVNNQRIGDQVLAPVPTDYRKTVLYNTYDVTAQVKTGQNVVGVVLGNGRFFTMRQNYKPQKINNFGYPRLLLQLEIEYTDGKKETIVTDPSWKIQTDGPIRTNNEYDGEEYDATRELTGWLTTAYAGKGWMNAELVPAPQGKLRAQMTPPMRVMQTIKPISLKQSKPGTYIMDMGQNFSGWVKMHVSGKKGHTVQLRFAESLQPSGELYVANLRDARVTDKYTLKGDGKETWEPSFVYHGFRYVEITGFPGEPKLSDFEGKFVYDDMQNTGRFVSSDTIMNKLFRNAWWGIASNYKGMPVDCPQRNERQPWLGDRATGSLGESYLFDNASLYAKWMQDIEDAQTAEGAIPDVAPAFWNYYSDNVTWPGTYLMTARMLYYQFGDSRSITRHYSSMKKWMDYMKDRYLKDELITKDKYGDWCVPPESLELIRSRDSMRNTDGQLIASAYYYLLLGYMQEFAEVSGNQKDIPAYRELADRIRQAFNKKYLNRQKNYYANNTVTANLLPLYFDMVPDSLREAVFNNIYNKIKIDNHMHISTGVIGTQWLMRCLTEFQRSDIAFTLASNKTYPSWGYMTENGATTIWELWNGNTANPQMNSQNHVMLLGDLLVWYYEHAAGIKQAPGSTAFRQLEMKPELIDGLDSVYASYRTPYGLVNSHWKNENDQFTWLIRIPANTTARIWLPAASTAGITINGNPLGEIKEVKLEKTDGRYLVFAVGSGTYSFVAPKSFRKGIVKDEFIFDRASFPESHAATIAETPEGLIASWFGGTKEGNKDVCIWVSHLKNDQWSAPQKVADGILNDSTRYACYNPVLYQVPGGDLLLFYKIGPNVAGWTGWMIRSSDNGHTWSQREALPDGFLGPIKNKPVMVGNQLVCPSSTEKGGWRAHLEMTSDQGRTWTKTGPLNDGTIFSAIQPSVLFYKDGSMQILCRSKNRTLNESWSKDGGKTWSAMQASPLPNNNSGTDAVTLQDGRQLLVYNHVKPAPELKNGKGPRTPLNVAVTVDGKKWMAALVLEDSPVSQYSYPSVIQGKDGMVHIVYTWRRERIKYVRVDPSKLQLTPIENEQWPGSKVGGAQLSQDD